MMKSTILDDLKLGFKIFSIKKNFNGPSLVTWPFIGSALAFFAFGTIIYKAERYGLTFQVGVLSEVAATVPFLGLAVLYRSFWNTRLSNKISRIFSWIKLSPTIFILAGTYAVGALRGTLADEISYWFTPSNYEIHYADYFLEGLTLTFFVMTYMAITGARRAHRLALAEFQEKKIQLGIYEGQEQNLIRSEVFAIRKLTLNQIAPRLQEILKQFQSGDKPSSLAANIQDALENTVRPLGEELHDKSLTWNLEEEISNASAPKLASIPKLIYPRVVYNPTISVLFFSPLFVLGGLATSNWEQAPRVMFQLVFGFMFLQIIKQLLPNKAWKRSTVVIFLIFTGLSSDLPSTFILHLNDIGSALFWSTYIQAMGISPVWFLLIGYLLLAFHKADIINERTARLLLDIERRKNLLRQKIWVERRNWSYLIHGTVQSSLTAAMTRLADPASERERIIEDLERALEAVINPPKADVDLHKEISDLELTWQGISKLEFDFSIEALNVLERNADLRFAVNEILKEGASNAIRHGNSKLVSTEINVLEGELVIDMRNETDKEINSSQTNLGSKMLDELTTWWSLSKEPDNFVYLRATLAIA